MVELKFHIDPTSALLYWEWYEAAPLRTEQTKAAQGALSSAEQQVQTQGLLRFPAVTPGTALISYYLSSTEAFVWVSDRTGVRGERLTLSRTLLDAQVKQLVEHCSNPESMVQDMRSEGTELYQELLKPIEPWISEDSKIVVEPDGILKALPFEVLIDSEGRYLVDRFDITVSPGIAYLNSARQWKGISASSKVLILGNPMANGWMSLPDAEQEARVIATFFPRSQLLLERDASNVNLDLAIGQSDVFHFAGHATATVRSIGLITGTKEPLRSFDGARKGRCELVVLSACDTSRGTIGLFDDEDSLVRRLMVAHVPEVIASRWSVNSEATSDLMTTFYRQLLAGQPVAASLAFAARSVRAQPKFSHPYYWAAFSAFGSN
jgi:CHAT domain-containing protein